MSIAPTGTVYTELQPVVDELDRQLAEVHAQHCRELDALFAADLDELIRDTGPDTSEWPIFADLPAGGWVPDRAEAERRAALLATEQWLDQGPAADEQLPGGRYRRHEEPAPLLPWLADAARTIWGRR